MPIFDLDYLTSSIALKWTLFLVNYTYRDSPDGEVFPIDP